MSKVNFPHFAETTYVPIKEKKEIDMFVSPDIPPYFKGFPTSLILCYLLLNAPDLNPVGLSDQFSSNQRSAARTSSSVVTTEAAPAQPVVI